MEWIFDRLCCLDSAGLSRDKTVAYPALQV
jgi:hypothetical protein